MRLAVAPVISLLVLGLASGCGGGSGSGGTELEGQQWVLASGVEAPPGAAYVRPDATFSDGTMSGTTGCNRYSASFTIDGDSFELGPITATEMGCLPPADAIERDFVAALEQVSEWRLEDGALVLSDEDGTELLRFAVPEPEPESP